MGRAIVRDPKAFLMDEPLSNLDAKLRVQMRTQVSRLQKRLGTTTVYVTHDQTEAMTLGDRVVVMRSGLVQQVGSPQVLYERPVNLFVAGFIGSPSMNFLAATLENGSCTTPLGDIPLTPEHKRALERQNLDRRGHRRAPPGGLRGRRTGRGPGEDARRDIRRPRSTSSSRWARTSSPTSRCRAAGRRRPSSKSSPATPAAPRWPQTPTRWSPGSTRRPGRGRERRSLSGSTLGKVHVFDPHSGENVTTEAVAGTNDGARSPSTAADPAPQSEPGDGGRHERGE